MKKVLLFFFIIFYSFQIVAAQEYNLNYNKNEVRISFSDGIPLRVVTSIASIFTDIFSNQEVLESSSIGHWSAGYRYFTSHKVALGGDITLQTVDYDFQHKNGGSSSQKLTYATIMPAFEFNYYRNDLIRLYGSLMAGIGLVTIKTSFYEDEEDNFDNDNYIAPAFQINPIGVRIGKQFGGFLELGVGSKGFVTLGASACF